MGKPFWQSRTFWFNVLVFVLAVAAYVLEGVQAGRFSEWMQIDRDSVAMLLTLVNLILRSMTSEPITLR